MRPNIIAADIGGSHISSTLTNTDNWQRDANKAIATKVDTFGDKKAIIHGWIQNLRQTAYEANIRKNHQIAIALPGPFNYENGIFQTHPEGKMNSLVGENFSHLLIPHFGKDLKISFENDAACFGLGEACFGTGKQYQKIMGITIGTGIGSSFIVNKKIIKSHSNIPLGGELYAESYKNSIADDYFSTRWFVQQTAKDLALRVNGVKDLIEQVSEEYIHFLFKKFTVNLFQFLLPYAKDFDAEIIVLGGNITKAWRYFGDELSKLFEKEAIAISLSSLNEQAIMLGAAKVFADKNQS